MAAGVKVDLAYSVSVQENPGARFESFGPGEVEIPKWAAKQMGDHCFTDGDRGSAPAYSPAGAAPTSVTPTSGGSGGSDRDELLQQLAEMREQLAALTKANGGGDPDAGATDWSKSTVEDLKAEIESRNADRDEDDHIVPAEPGNKPQLVEALEADDAAAADED